MSMLRHLLSSVWCRLETIHLLLCCNFCSDIHLPPLATGIDNSHLAAKPTQPSLMTWKTAIASIDQEYHLSCVPWCPVVTLSLQGFLALFLIQKILSFRFLSLQTPPDFRVPPPLQLPPALSNGLNLARDIEISKKVRRRLGGWLMWTHCAPSECQVELTAQPEPWWKTILIVWKHRGHWN